VFESWWTGMSLNLMERCWWSWAGGFGVESEVGEPLGVWGARKVSTCLVILGLRYWFGDRKGRVVINGCGFWFKVTLEMEKL